MSESNGRSYVVPGSSWGSRDAAQPAALPDNLRRQFCQMTRKLTADLEELKTTGTLMKSASRQLSSGVQELKNGLKEMNQGLSYFKVNDKVSS